MIPVDQLSDAELLEILHQLDRRGMRVPLATATREVQRYRCTARAIPPNVSGTGRLLDLGAGRQWLPFYECVLGYRHISMNTLYPDSAELTGDLRVDGVSDLEVDVSVFDVERDVFPFADASFDVVCCLQLLEHLAVDPMHMMSEINRVLKPGGTLVVTTPNVVRHANLVAMVLGEHPYGWAPYNGHDTNRHNREYTPHEVRSLADAAGFDVTTLSTFGRRSRGFKRDLLQRLAATLLSPLRRCPRSLRNDFVLCVGERAGPVRCRRPEWLYFEMSDQIHKPQTQSTPVNEHSSNAECLVAPAAATT